MIVAIGIGFRGGLAAGTVAFALFSLGSIVEHLPISPVGYVNCAVVYLLVGGLVGRFADRLRGLRANSRLPAGGHGRPSLSRLRPSRRS